MNANDFSKRYILELKNVLKFKGIISEMDVEKIVTKMMKYIYSGKWSSKSRRYSYGYSSIIS